MLNTGCGEMKPISKVPDVHTVVFIFGLVFKLFYLMLISIAEFSWRHWQLNDTGL